MVGKGIYGFYVLQHAGLGGADCQKFSSAYPTFEPELTCPTNMTPKRLPQNHPNPLDTPNT
jgi:hypothetical protein